MSLSNGRKRASGFDFTTKARLAFLASYVLGKTLFLLKEVREPRARLLLYEAVYSFCRLLGRAPLSMRRLQIDHVSTRMGEFHVRPGTIDAACVSPGFERQDMLRLLVVIKQRLDRGLRVLFLDVGADIGTYAVSIGNAFRGRYFTVVAYEPSASSYALLDSNIALNGLKGMTILRNLALSDVATPLGVLHFNPEEPGSSGLRWDLVSGAQRECVAVTTLNQEALVIPAYAAADVLCLKLDVEGAEKNVLAAADECFAAADEVILLVEDFVDASIIEYLESNGWTFEAKLTPYNSFWRWTRNACLGAAL